MKGWRRCRRGAAMRALVRQAKRGVQSPMGDEGKAPGVLDMPRGAFVGGVLVLPRHRWAVASGPVHRPRRARTTPCGTPMRRLNAADPVLASPAHWAACAEACRAWGASRTDLAVARKPAWSAAVCRGTARPGRYQTTCRGAHAGGRLSRASAGQAHHVAQAQAQAQALSLVVDIADDHGEATPMRAALGTTRAITLALAKRPLLTRRRPPFATRTHRPVLRFVSP